MEKHTLRVDEIPHYVPVEDRTKEDRIMKLSAPKNTTFWVATVLAVLGFLGNFVNVPFVTANAFWFVVVGFVVLWLGAFVKGF